MAARTQQHSVVGMLTRDVKLDGRVILAGTRLTFTGRTRDGTGYVARHRGRKVKFPREVVQMQKQEQAGTMKGRKFAMRGSHMVGHVRYNRVVVKHTPQDEWFRHKAVAYGEDTRANVPDGTRYAIQLFYTHSSQVVLGYDFIDAEMAKSMKALARKVFARADARWSDARSDH